MPFAIDLIREHHTAELNDLGTLASLDASTFSMCIHAENKAEVMERYRAAIARKARDVGAAGGFQVGTKWDESSLKSVYDKVIFERAGVCTSFAKASAYILSKGGKLDRHKIEIVAYKNHVFLVIGRTAGNTVVEGEGMFAKTKLSHFCEWGFGWAIVDVWAMAMGYADFVYHQNVNYPFQSMLDPLVLIMSREVEPAKPTRPVPVLEPVKPTRPVPIVEPPKPTRPIPPLGRE